MKYSIIVPLYNKAPYVRKALDSIVAQTYKDWECIIINDGSSDNSLEVVKNFVDEFMIYDLRFKIVNQSNAGVAAARNNGVAASTGEYVCFLDADDGWEPTFLEEMEKLISEYPDAGIYVSNYIYYKPSKTHVVLSLPRGNMNYPKAYYEGGAMPVTSITTCMPHKVFDEMRGFPLGIKLGEDFLLWAKTALHYPVAYSKKPLAYYNNNVPATMRATRNLHAPEYHMLFNFQPIEAEMECDVENVKYKEEWKILLDKLRVSGLMDYWLSDEYHDIAAVELQKVDWNKQPHNAKAQYEKPIWYLKAKRCFMQIGGYWKQKNSKTVK